MDERKELMKSFHVSRQTAEDFEKLRLDLFRTTGIRVGHSDFFAYLVREATKNNNIKNTKK